MGVCGFEFSGFQYLLMLFWGTEHLAGCSHPMVVAEVIGHPVKDESKSQRKKGARYLAPRIVYLSVWLTSDCCRLRLSPGGGELR
jgi:hypothetical protein